MSATTPPPVAFHLIARPTGAVCNLDCHYCFFFKKEALYPGSAFRMSDEGEVLSLSKDASGLTATHRHGAQTRVAV